jgi:hypothetical protein
VLPMRTAPAVWLLDGPVMTGPSTSNNRIVGTSFSMGYQKYNGFPQTMQDLAESTKESKKFCGSVQRMESADVGKNAIKNQKP